MSQLLKLKNNKTVYTITAQSIKNFVMNLTILLAVKTVSLRPNYRQLTITEDYDFKAQNLK